MFMVSIEDSTAIRDAYANHGELAAVMELRRLYPIFVGRDDAAQVARSIASWRPPAEAKPTCHSSTIPEAG